MLFLGQAKGKPDPVPVWRDLNPDLGTYPFMVPQEFDENCDTPLLCETVTPMHIAEAGYARSRP